MKTQLSKAEIQAIEAKLIEIQSIEAKLIEPDVLDRMKHDEQLKKFYDSHRKPTPKKYYGNVTEITAYSAIENPEDPNYIPPEGLIIGYGDYGKPIYW